MDHTILEKRLALAGSSGPAALIKNIRVFGIAAFACIGRKLCSPILGNLLTYHPGGLLYGYNQGVFSGVLTMNNFGQHMGVYIADPTKKGWLTSILELGAWLGTLYSGFVAEIFSRKYAIIINTCMPSSTFPEYQELTWIERPVHHWSGRANYCRICFWAFLYSWRSLCHRYGYR